MKNILIILIMLSASILPAQDKIDKLADKVDKIAEQQAITNAKLDKLSEIVTELAKQQAITATKVDTLEKSVDKRLDTQMNFTIGLIGLIGVLIAAIIWDRRSNVKFSVSTPIPTLSPAGKGLFKSLDLKSPQQGEI